MPKSLKKIYPSLCRKRGERHTIPHQPICLFPSWFRDYYFNDDDLVILLLDFLFPSILMAYPWAVFIRLRLREGKAGPKLLIWRVSIFPHYSTESCNIDVSVFEPVSWGWKNDLACGSSIQEVSTIIPSCVLSCIPEVSTIMRACWSCIPEISILLACRLCITEVEQCLWGFDPVSRIFQQKVQQFGFSILKFLFPKRLQK